MIVELLKGGTLQLEGRVLDSYLDKKIGGLVLVMSTGLKVTLPPTEENLNKFKHDKEK